MDARSTRFSATVVLGSLALALTACGASAPEHRARNAPAYGPTSSDEVAAGAPPAQAQPGGEAAAKQAEARPGLGTEWGEQRLSRMTNVPFERADASRPFAMGSVFYNDQAGVDAATAGQRRAAISAVSLSGGAVTLQLKDDRGQFLGGFQAGDRNYVVGAAGKRYSIVVRNATASRIETVVSVDGLDVINGKAANFQNRGYLLDPRGEIEIDGFRTSTEAVAAFRFGAVKDSYAEKKTGDSRNVGVIGVALFHERGTGIPTLINAAELQKRNDANPFPGQFATPP